jgi:hypothetical protein
MSCPNGVRGAAVIKVGAVEVGHEGPTTVPGEFMLFGVETLRFAEPGRFGGGYVEGDEY